jgi:hypothetical protein
VYDPSLYNVRRPRSTPDLPGAAYAMRPLSVARDLDWCDHDYARWGMHTMESTPATPPVLGPPTSIMGSELPGYRAPALLLAIRAFLARDYPGVVIRVTIAVSRLGARTHDVPTKGELVATLYCQCGQAHEVWAEFWWTEGRYQWIFFDYE